MIIILFFNGLYPSEMLLDGLRSSDGLSGQGVKNLSRAGLREPRRRHRQRLVARLQYELKFFFGVPCNSPSDDQSGARRRAAPASPGARLHERRIDEKERSDYVGQEPVRSCLSAGWNLPGR